MLEDPGGHVKDMLRPLKRWAELNWSKLGGLDQEQFNLIEETLRDDILEIMELAAPKNVQIMVDDLKREIDRLDEVLRNQRIHITKITEERDRALMEIERLKEQIELHEAAELETRRTYAAEAW